MHSKLLVTVESSSPARKQIAGLLFLLLLITSCAKSSISERDAKREQLKSAAETKRKELQVVAGDYQGTLTQVAGLDQNTTLSLEIKDIPTVVEGNVDPVPVPTLKGFLRFNLGAGAGGAEFVSFSIDKADFDPRRNKLDLVVSNPQFKEMVISTVFDGTSKLSGTWTSPSSAASGSVALDRKQVMGGTIAEQLRGEYGGIFLNEAKQLYQFGQLTISTSVNPPEGLKVVASLRIIFGDLNSTEYLTYKFDPVEFNPMTGQVILRNEANDVMLSGFWSKGEFKGEWHSNYTGKIGAAHFTKSLTPSTPEGSLVETIKGTYKGTHVTTNPHANLPERMMVSFVTSQDSTKPNGITIGGSLRWFIGSETEFIDCRFSVVQYNFFTRILTAVTLPEGDCGTYTLKGEVNQKNIKGTVSADALGEVGNFEVKK